LAKPSKKQSKPEPQDMIEDSNELLSYKKWLIAITVESKILQKKVSYIFLFSYISVSWLIDSFLNDACRLKDKYDQFYSSS